MKQDIVINIEATKLKIIIDLLKNNFQVFSLYQITMIYEIAMVFFIIQ